MRKSAKKTSPQMLAQQQQQQNLEIVPATLWMTQLKGVARMMVDAGTVAGDWTPPQQENELKT